MVYSMYKTMTSTVTMDDVRWVMLKTIFDDVHKPTNAHQDMTKMADEDVQILSRTIPSVHHLAAPMIMDDAPIHILMTMNAHQDLPKTVLADVSHQVRMDIPVYEILHPMLMDDVRFLLGRLEHVQCDHIETCMDDVLWKLTHH